MYGTFTVRKFNLFLLLVLILLGRSDSDRVAERRIGEHLTNEVSLEKCINKWEEG